MMKKLDLLKKTGCDMDMALERFLGDEELLLECIGDTLCDDGFQKLEEGIRNNNVKDSFEAAHSLKGICGNVGLSPLFNTVCLMVEILRKGSLDGVDLYMNELLREKKEIENIFDEKN